MTLRKSLLLLVLMGFAVSGAFAKKEKKPVTEQTLINRLQGCLANKDAYCYIDLWPDLDTLTSQHNRIKFIVRGTIWIIAALLNRAEKSEETTPVTEEA